MIKSIQEIIDKGEPSALERVVSHCPYSLCVVIEGVVSHFPISLGR